MRTACLVLGLLATESVVRAQGYGPPSSYGAPPPVYGAPAGAHRHDGAWVRAFLGLGGTRMSASDLTVKGAGGTLGLGAGYAVKEDWVLYAEVFDDVTVNPRVTLGAFEGTTKDTSAGVVGLGLGAAHYFMPINLYVSATLAASRLVVQENGADVGRSRIGVGLSAMVGKEWWVSDNWGVGVAAQLFGGSMKDEGPMAYTWTALAFGIVFSATYN